MDAPFTFRNMVRYVRDPEASARAYEALGFRRVRTMEALAVLENEAGFRLVLHGLVPGLTQDESKTAIGYTLTGDLDEARRFLEAAGFRLVREPKPTDMGRFWIFWDPDGHPVNLVAPRRTEPQPTALG